MVDSAYFQTICLYFSMQEVSSKSYLQPSSVLTTQLILYISLQSILMSRQQLKEAFSWMSGEKSDKSEVLLATANLDQVCSFSISMGTLFGVMSKGDEFEGACFCLLLD